MNHIALTNALLISIFLIGFTGCRKSPEENFELGKAEYERSRPRNEENIENYAEAIRLLQMSAEGGNVDAMHHLGKIYDMHGKDLNHREEGIKWWKLASEQGHASSTYGLGNLYYYRDSFDDSTIEPDYKMAEKYFKKAVEQGRKFANRHLGDMYAEGKLGLKDKEKAEKFYTEGDDFKSLAKLYLDSEPYKSARYYEQAIEKGDQYAMKELAKMYFHGDYIHQDLSKSLELFEMAKTEMLEPGSYGNVREIRKYIAEIHYRGGNGVAKDPAKAMRIYKEYFYVTDKDIAFIIGEMYLLGEGVEQDLIKAYALLLYSSTLQKGEHERKENSNSEVKFTNDAPVYLDGLRDLMPQQARNKAFYLYKELAERPGSWKKYF